jgi:fibronectin-binding autotransporter adhesin
MPHTTQALRKAPIRSCHYQSLFAALLAGASIGVLAVLASSPARAQTGPFLYVPDSGSSVVSIVDTSTNTVPFSPIPVGPGLAAVVRGDGSIVYLTDNDGSVIPVDTTANTLGTPIPVEAIVQDAALTPNGKTLFVANVPQGNPGALGFVTPIDAASGIPGTPIDVGYNPRGVVVSPDGRTLYVANLIVPSLGMGTVTPVDIATGTVGTPIPVGPGNQAFSLAITPDGKTLYASDPFSNNLTVINTVTKAVSTIPLGATSFGLAVTPNGQTLYVANASADTVTVVNTATNTVEETIPVAGAPNGVAVSPDGKTVYITDFSASSVTPINTATNAVGTPIPLGVNPEIFPGIASNGNALLASGLTFVARTSGALESTLASGPTGSPGPIFTGGTLQFAGANIASGLPIGLEDEGGTFDTLANTATLSGLIGGPGELTKIGTGTLILTGDNTYTGGTTITAGTLQLGNGGMSGSIMGDVTDNAALAFDRSDIVTFSGMISGTGSVAQIGIGTTILTGDNIYTGGTTITAGTLQLGNGGMSGSIIGDVANNGTLVFDRSNLLNFDGAISGAGNVAQIGIGTTLLTGDSTYTGTTTVSSGALIVHGALTGTSVVSVGDAGAATLTIEQGGSISSASGVLGNLAGTSGTAIVTDGNSAWLNSGTLTVGGAGAGTLTLSDEARVSAASVVIAGQAGSTGTLNIGAPAGEAAGTLDTPTVTFGSGTGTLNFNQNDSTYNFNAILSGTGSIVQNAPGFTILTANSSAFAGTTSVNAGTLVVNGTLGNAASTLAVNNGGTLTGSGNVGGAVTVNSGGTLAGVQGQTVVLGPLTLNSGSNLDVVLGAPGTTRLFNVNGALTLGGTLNVADLGGFGPGTYRLIDYSGALTNNGLAIGTVPSGITAADLTVQTSVAQQVNLINSTGVALQFWDGPNGPNNGVIDGGTGTWDLVSQNWTNANGTINGTWSTDFAIFEGAPGTVTVATSGGPIAANGMQFAVTGYVVTGGTLMLQGADPVIRVGDGTAAGASYVATIDSVLAGSGELVKTDLGTLVLGGANTYSGGTLISNGTLSVSSDSNLGAASGALTFLNGTLETTANMATSRAISTLQSATFQTDPNTSLELDGAITGVGSLTKSGSGTLVLAGQAGQTGGTTIAAGTLQIGKGGTAGSLSGDVTNNGVLAVDRSDTYTFSGAIIGTGAFAQIGTGTTVLTGASDYAGGTTISAGTLELGAGGSIIGTVTNNATFAIDRADTFALDTAISGTGAFAQSGTGTTILTGENTYTGGTTISAGTLVIGDGSTSGSITGNVVDNATLAFDRADIVMFPGTISGAGAVQQIGGGTTILTGSNTYTGGTTIADGTLQLGNGGTSGAIAGNVVDNGTLAIDRSDNVTFGGAISGTGEFTQIGAGTTVLTANNTYTGSTIVASGGLTVHGALSGTTSLSVGDGGSALLTIENGGAISDATGSVGRVPATSGTATVTGAGSAWSNSGTLTIGDAGTGTLSVDHGASVSAAEIVIGDVGSGSLSIANGASVSAPAIVIADQAGSIGTLTIGAPSGETPAASGTLDPPTITFGSGNGTLQFNQTDATYIFDAVLVGPGTIVQNGPGTTILTADSSGFTGNTVVADGALEVDGILGGPGSTVTVNAGDTLEGTGTIGGAVSISKGGTLSPGGTAIGTITIGGNLAFAPGSNYRVDLSPGAADLTRVGGTATPAGAVNVIAAPGSYPASETYTILTAAGGVNGTFDSLTTATNSIFLQPSLRYDANDVYLVLSSAPFSSVAVTANQQAVAGAVASLAPSNPVFDALFDAQSAQQARAGLDALSGEIHASMAGEMLQESRYVRDAVLARLRGSYDVPDPPDPQYGAWIASLGAFGSAGSDANAADFDRSVVGLIAGFDAALSNTLRGGIAGAYTHSAINIDARASQATSDDFTIALYGAGTLYGLDVRGGAAYAWQEVRTLRAIDFDGFFDNDRAHYQAPAVQAFGELGYGIPVDTVTLEPFVNAAYVNLNENGFAETGGAAALASPSQTLDTEFATAGIHASHFVTNILEAPLALRGTLGWVHDFGDVTPGLALAFASGSTPFTIDGTPLARNSALAELGFDIAIGEHAKFAVDYSGEIADRVRDNALRATLAWNF